MAKVIFYLTTGHTLEVELESVTVNQISGHVATWKNMPGSKRKLMALRGEMVAAAIVIEDDADNEAA